MEITQSTNALKDTKGLNIGKYAPSVADLFNAGKFKVSATKMVASKDKKALHSLRKFKITFKSIILKNFTFKVITIVINYFTSCSKQSALNKRLP